MRSRALLFFALLLVPATLQAQARKPMTVAELVTYSGKDREQVLYEEPRPKAR